MCKQQALNDAGARSLLSGLGPEEPTETLYRFEDKTGTLFIYKEAELRTVGLFHHHDAKVHCGACLFPDAAWGAAWQGLRLWAQDFDAVRMLRKIQEEYEQSRLAVHGPLSPDGSGGSSSVGK